MLPLGDEGLLKVRECPGGQSDTENERPKRVKPRVSFFVIQINLIGNYLFMRHNNNHQLWSFVSLLDEVVLLKWTVNNMETVQDPFNGRLVYYYIVIAPCLPQHT